MGGRRRGAWEWSLSTLVGTQGCSKRTDKQLDGRSPTKRSSRPTIPASISSPQSAHPGPFPSTPLPPRSRSLRLLLPLLHLLLHFVCVLWGGGQSQNTRNNFSIHLVGLRDLAQALRHGDKCLLLLPFTLPLRAEIGRICFEFYIHRIRNMSVLAFPSPSLKTHILGVGGSSRLFPPGQGARPRGWGGGGGRVLCSVH